jgi:hypothetical protein
LAWHEVCEMRSTAAHFMVGFVRPELHPNRSDKLHPTLG